MNLGESFSESSLIGTSYNPLVKKKVSILK